MHLLWKRYARSGHAPPWFYAVMAVGFTGLAVWGAVRQDWVVAGVAAVMIAVTVVGSRVMRRLSEAAEASQKAIDAGEDGDDG